jgi:Tn3 transposase DDE domain
MEPKGVTLDWISDPALRRRANAGLNKGEARNALARAVFFHRLGEIRDRAFENQRYRASGLNLAVAAIILWNTVSGAPLTSCVPAARSSAMSCFPISPRSAGSTSPSMAITYGRQSRSKIASVPSEIPA